MVPARNWHGSPSEAEDGESALTGSRNSPTAAGAANSGRIPGLCLGPLSRASCTAHAPAYNSEMFAWSSAAEAMAVFAVSYSASFRFLASAYLLGSVPFALLLGLWRGVDIRTAGSRNIGATNLSRIAGRRWGMAAFVLDFLKGLLPVLLVRWMAAPWPAVDGALSDSSGPRIEHVQMACALSAILGHIFPIYLRFRGGKGVATSFGAITGLSWMAALIAGIVWGAVYAVTRTVSIASLVAAIAFPVATFVIHRAAPADVAVPLDILTVAVAALIFIRHHSNIRRLLTGREHRF